MGWSTLTVDYPDQSDAGLPDVVGTEGCGHRNTSSLPEGVVLHRTDEIDGDLGDLVRGGLRQGPKNCYDQHFHQDQQSVPPDEAPAAEGAGPQKPPSPGDKRSWE